MKEEYKVLNEVEIDISQYEEEIVDELEKKRMMKKFRKSKKNKMSFRNKTIVAAVTALFVAVSVGANGYTALGVVDDFKSNLSTWLGLDYREKNYTTEVNETTKDAGIELTLDEFFTDNNSIVINFDINITEDEIDMNNLSLVPDLYVNGKIFRHSEGTNNAVGYSINAIKHEENGLEDKTSVGVEFQVNGLNLTKKENIKLVFSKLAKEYSIDEKKLTFDFEYDINNYMNDCKTVEVNKIININGSTLEINKVIVAPGRIIIDGKEQGFSKLTSSMDKICCYYIYDQDNNRISLKKDIGDGAYFITNGRKITSLKIVPWTVQKIDTNNTKFDESIGKTMYFSDKDTIVIDLK